MVRAGIDEVSALTDEWRELLVTAVGNLLGTSRRAVLIDCPDHGNVGDSLIALGELEVLRTLGCHLADVSSSKEQILGKLRSLPRETAILIHGGGNFGDVWPTHQRLREDLARECPDRTIIQLPQSIHFSDPDYAERSSAVLRSHQRFVVLCRDAESLGKAQALGLQATLTPDMALALRPLRGLRTPEHPVVVVRRTDHESQAGSRGFTLPADWHEEDWVRDVPGTARERARVRQVRPYVPAVFGSALGRWSMERAFASRMAYGLDLVSKGRVVLTDRLHVHVLCTLAGISHAFVDNNYGKLTALWDSWTHPVSFAQPCSSWQEAITWATSRLRTPGDV